MKQLWEKGKGGIQENNSTERTNTFEFMLIVHIVHTCDSLRHIIL